MSSKIQSLYEKIGGEESLKKLVETFYDIIEEDPDGKIVHDLHLKGHGINTLAERNLNFFQDSLAVLSFILIVMVILIYV